MKLTKWDEKIGILLNTTDIEKVIFEKAKISSKYYIARTYINKSFDKINMELETSSPKTIIGNITIIKETEKKENELESIFMSLREFKKMFNIQQEITDSIPLIKDNNGLYQAYMDYEMDTKLKEQRKIFFYMGSNRDPYAIEKAHLMMEHEN